MSTEKSVRSTLKRANHRLPKLLWEIAVRGTVDTLNSDFMEWYIAEFKPPYISHAYGAPQCRQLGKDLSHLRKAGYLSRHIVGLPGMEWGFPKWVYTYSIKPEWDPNYDPNYDPFTNQMRFT